MKNIRCLVVDDEQLARTLLQTYIDRLPHLDLVQTCKRPSEALAKLQESPIDLVFLDIQMPELTGVELLQTLVHPPLVIFTTAYQEYALKGYELDIVDYLLKPFGFERFVQAVNKATEQLRLRQLDQHSGAQASNYLLIKADHKVHRVAYEEIDYIQGMREYVLFFTRHGKIMSLQSMKSLEAELPREQFIRIHKSYIVATRLIRVFEGSRLVVGEEKLPVGNHYRERVLEQIFR